jgi:hypothetical protein
LDKLLEDVTTIAKEFGISEAAAADMYEKLRQLDAEQKKRAARDKLGTTSVTDILGDAKKAMDAITSATGIVNDTLQGLFQSLDSGFNSAMQDIVAGTATAGSIVKTIWHSIVDAIIAELARIAAAQAIKGVVKLVSSILPFLSKSPALPVTSVLAPAAASLAALQPHAQAPVNDAVSKQSTSVEAPVPQNIQNIMVLGYDNHSIVQDLTSPTGKLRSAYGRVSFMGSY